MCDSVADKRVQGVGGRASSTYAAEHSKRSLTATSAHRSTADAQYSLSRDAQDGLPSPRKPSARKALPPDKPKFRAWNSLWSLDVNVESVAKEKK